jgi:hypothetical protein
MAVFWDFAPCSLLDTDLRFRSSYCLHHQGGRTSEISVNIYQTTRRNIPEDSHLHTPHREILKSHQVQ